MKETIRSARILFCFLPVLSGCATSYEPPASLSLAELESNRRYTERIETDGRDQEHSERMRRAQAAEMATRNAPSSVSTTQVFAPRF